MLVLIALPLVIVWNLTEAVGRQDPSRTSPGRKSPSRYGVSKQPCPDGQKPVLDCVAYLRSRQVRGQLEALPLLNAVISMRLTQKPWLFLLERSPWPSSGGSAQHQLR